MNYIFFDIFNLLKDKNKKNYEDFISLENNLEEMISQKIDEFIKREKNFNKLNLQDKKNINFFLLDEKYISNISLDYPFYNNFYFTEYVNENYLYEKLKHKESNKYPVLFKYLEHINNPRNNEEYSLNNLKLYNNTLNLLNEKYSHIILREESKDIILENEEIYKNNDKLIDKFISFYNQLNIKDSENKKMELSKKNPLSDFFIDDNNNIGKSYKIIYLEFIKKQNQEIEQLIKIKVNERIFDESSLFKVDIQNINENEIFLLDLPKKFSFIDIVFNWSYRDIVNSNDYNTYTYNQFQIDFELIEEKFTEILLENKKLFKNNINNFVYKNEDLLIDNKDIIFKFKEEIITEDLILDDKVILYQYYEENKEDIQSSLKILNDFTTIIINLITKKDLMESIKDKKVQYIYEIFQSLDNNISDDFKQIFQEKKNFTICKLYNIFEYYQKLVSENILNELKEFQIEIKEDIKKKVISYFNNPHKIDKEIFSKAIHLFIILYLSKINNKKNKIKFNCNNIINYFDIPDLWDKKIYNMDEFNVELNKLKDLNIQINQIINLYDIIGEKYNENYFSQEILQIKKNEEQEKKRKEDEEMANHKKNENDNENIPKEKDDDYYDKDDDDSKDDEEFIPRD